MSILRLEPRFNLLQIVEDVKQFDHRLPYNHAQGTSILNTPLGVIPPFQLIKLNGWTWTKIELVNFETGAVTNVKTAMELTGLEIVEYDGTGAYGDYDVWVYPGSVQLPVSGINEGVHYLRLQDQDGNWVFIGLFTFMDGLEDRRDYVKLEWWNLKDLHLDFEEIGGVKKTASHIRYVAPFKWWVYLKSDLAIHGWKFEQQSEVRDGVESIRTITRFKEFSFRFICPEYLVDSLTLIPLHDKKTVTYNGITYEKIWRLLPDAKAVGAGNLYAVEILFHLNQTTNTQHGTGYLSSAYTPAEGACLPSATECAAIITNGSAEYTGGYWTDEFGANHSFNNGDYVIVEISGLLVLRQWNGSTYISPGPANYSSWRTVHDSQTGQLARGDFYFFAYSNILYDTPQVTTSTPGTPYTVAGNTFENTLIQIVLKDENGNEWIAVTDTAANFNGAGVQFTIGSATAFKVRTATPACPALTETDWIVNEGVDFDLVEDTLVVYPEGVEGVPDPAEDE